MGTAAAEADPDGAGAARRTSRCLPRQLTQVVANLGKTAKAAIALGL
jgi:hypothetical protein